MRNFSLEIFLIILALCSFGIVSVVIGSIKYKISPAASNIKVMRCIKNYLLQRKSIVKFIDVGSGFGFVCLYLSWSFPNLEIQGIEVQGIPYGVSVFLKWAFRRKNLKFFRKDFFSLSQLDAGCVFCYLYSDRDNLVADHLKKILRKNTEVISSTFKLNLKCNNEIQVNDLYHSPVFFYEI